MACARAAPATCHVHPCCNACLIRCSTRSAAPDMLAGLACDQIQLQQQIAACLLRALWRHDHVLHTVMIDDEAGVTVDLKCALRAATAIRRAMFPHRNSSHLGALICSLRECCGSPSPALATQNRRQISNTDDPYLWALIVRSRARLLLTAGKRCHELAGLGNKERLAHT